LSRHPKIYFSKLVFEVVAGTKKLSNKLMRQDFDDVRHREVGSQDVFSSTLVALGEKSNHSVSKNRSCILNADR